MHAPELTFERARALRRSMTLPEVLLWEAIRPRACKAFRFRRQHPFGSYILDFYEPGVRLAVEVDGDYAHSITGAPAHDARAGRLAEQAGACVFSGCRRESCWRMSMERWLRSSLRRAKAPSVSFADSSP